METRPGGYLAADAVYDGGHLLENIVLFVRMCRALGMHVTPQVTREIGDALTLIDVGRRQDFYQTLLCLMVTHQRDLALFDQLFAIFWQPPANNPVTVEARVFSKTIRQQPMRFLLPPGTEPDDPTQPEDQPLDLTLNALVPTYSPYEMLRYKNFAAMTAEELAMAQRLMGQLPWSLGARRTRRYRRGAGRSLDLRGVLRGSMKTAGEALHLNWRTTRIKPRPVVLLCDISGSMERYTRILMHFTHTLANSMYQVESFVFATHLTRITRSVRRKSVDAALGEVGRSVGDWGAGTRTGDCLREFNFRWARRVLGRGAVVLLITDGWDRGDPLLLKREVERLGRSCHRLIWLNPLLAAPGYEPLTRGAQAILPQVDDFLPVSNLANLETLVQVLADINWQRPDRKRVRAEVW